MNVMILAIDNNEIRNIGQKALENRGVRGVNLVVLNDSCEILQYALGEYDLVFLETADDAAKMVLLVSGIQKRRTCAETVGIFALASKDAMRRNPCLRLPLVVETGRRAIGPEFVELDSYMTLLSPTEEVSEDYFRRICDHFLAHWPEKYKKDEESS